jgi:hypothetical protein
VGIWLVFGGGGGLGLCGGVIGLGRGGWGGLGLGLGRGLGGGRGLGLGGGGGLGLGGDGGGLGGVRQSAPENPFVHVQANDIDALGGGGADDKGRRSDWMP